MHADSELDGSEGAFVGVLVLRFKRAQLDGGAPAAAAAADSSGEAWGEESYFNLTKPAGVLPLDRVRATQRDGCSLSYAFDSVHKCFTLSVTSPLDFTGAAAVALAALNKQQQELTASLHSTVAERERFAKTTEAETENGILTLGRLALDEAKLKRVLAENETLTNLKCTTRQRVDSITLQFPSARVGGHLETAAYFKSINALVKLTRAASETHASKEESRKVDILVTQRAANRQLHRPSRWEIKPGQDLGQQPRPAQDPGQQPRPVGIGAYAIV